MVINHLLTGMILQAPPTHKLQMSRFSSGPPNMSTCHPGEGPVKYWEGPDALIFGFLKPGFTPPPAATLSP